MASPRLAFAVSAREIADCLGHERVSTTRDVYLNRKTAGSSPAALAMIVLRPGAQRQGLILIEISP